MRLLLCGKAGCAFFLALSSLTPRGTRRGQNCRPSARTCPEISGKSGACRLLGGRNAASASQTLAARRVARGQIQCRHGGWDCAEGGPDSRQAGSDCRDRGWICHFAGWVCGEAGRDFFLPLRPCSLPGPSCSHGLSGAAGGRPGGRGAGQSCPCGHAPLGRAAHDNSMVETFFKTIKSELIWPVAWQSRQQAENAVARYIDGFYYPVRRHSSLDFQSPIAFERKAREAS